MKLTLKQIGNDAHFKAHTENGNTTEVHSPIIDGATKQAPSPMETLLVAAAGCTSVDVLLILKKMKQPIENLEIAVNGTRTPNENTKPFTSIDLAYVIVGDVDEKKANRAVKLSVEKYCSVLDSLNPEIEISWTVEITKN